MAANLVAPCCDRFLGT